MSHIFHKTILNEVSKTSIPLSRRGYCPVTLHPDLVLVPILSVDVDLCLKFELKTFKAIFCSSSELIIFVNMVAVASNPLTPRT